MVAMPPLCAKMRLLLLLALILILQATAADIAQVDDATDGGGASEDSDCGTPSADVTPPSIVAVTSCTGFVGSRVLLHLRRFYPLGGIRCLVHRGGSSKADLVSQLEHDLESVRHVDFLDEQSMVDALRGSMGLYLNTPPSDDVLEMRRTIASAIEHTPSLQHIVMLGEPVDLTWYGLSEYWNHHKEGEDAIQKTGVHLTVLHPAFFLDMFPGIVSADNEFNRVGGNPGPYSSVEDVAEVAARIIVEGPQKHGWKRYNLINELLTGDQIADVMAEVTGTEITYREISLSDFWEGMKESPHVTEKMAVGYTKAMALNQKGIYSADDRGQLQDLLGRRPRSAVDVVFSMRHHFKLDRHKNSNTTKHLDEEDCVDC